MSFTQRLKFKVSLERAYVILLVFAIVNVLFMVGHLNFTTWDYPGHVLNSIEFRDRLWPNISGWSDRCFGGFPIGYFYPSLFEWLSGGLGRLIPLTSALRVVLGLSVVAYPAVVSLFLKGQNFSRGASLCTITILLVMSLSLERPASFGGTITSTFYGGLVGSMLGMDFFFLYLWSLKRSFGSKKFVVWAAIFLALLTLSHGFEALVGYFSSLVVFAGRVIEKRSWGDVRRYFVHGIIFCFLIAFWLVPFIVYRDFSSGKAVEFNNLRLLIGNIPWFGWPHATLTLFGLLTFAKKPNLQIRSSIGLLACLVLLYGSLKALTFFNVDTGHYPLHSYRLLVFIFTFSCFIIGDLLSGYEHPVARKIILFALFTYVSVALINFDRHVLQINRGEARLEDPVAKYPAFLERTIVNISNVKDQITTNQIPHLFSTNLQMAKQSVLNGVFVESSIVSPFIYSYLDETFPKTYSANTLKANEDSTYIAQQTSLLGIQRIISDTAIPPLILQKLKSIGISDGARDPNSHNWSYSAVVPIVEFLSPPIAMFRIGQSQWNHFVLKWWAHPVPPFPVRAHHIGSEPSEMDFSNGEGDEVHVSFESPTELKLRIAAVKPCWIYVKVPYFPSWHAWQGGTEIPVYEAGPNMMAIRANGIVRMIFETPLWEKILARASGVTLVAALLYLICDLSFRRSKCASALASQSSQP